MQLSYPVIITGRLLPGVQIGNAFVSIEYAQRPGDEGRTRYRYFIDLPSGYRRCADDLQSGLQGGSLLDGLESLLVFLSDCQEGSNMFPQAVSEWAADNHDELSMLSCDLVDSDDLLKESP